MFCFQSFLLINLIQICTLNYVFYKFPQSPGCFTANSQDFIILFYFRTYAAYEDSIEVCPATEHEERKLYESNSVAQKMLPDPL